MAKTKEKIPMSTLEPRQESYAPDYPPMYRPQLQPYTPQPSYAPQSSYDPQPSYAPQPSYDPQSSYDPEPYTPEPYTPDPYAAEPYKPECCAPSDSCCIDCDPPPYTYEEIPCDRAGVVSMTNNPPVVVAGIFSSKPASTICPCCRQIIMTEVVFRVGSLTYAVCTAMCMMGCCFGCCLAPFMCKCCKDVDHYCPQCQYHIYRYKRL